MRIAYSAIFFTLHESQCSIALLSQLFLKDQKSSEYRVPLCSWKLGEHPNSSDHNLAAILQVQI